VAATHLHTPIRIEPPAVSLWVAAPRIKSDPLVYPLAGGDNAHMPDILFERDGHVATITLNRPDRLNPISGEMLDGLAEQLVVYETDPEVRAIILTGAGRGFCSGLDLKRAAAAGGLGLGSAGAVRIQDTPPLVMRRIDKPVLCALNGPAAGYGMDLALGCDLLIASDRAVFAPPIRRGLLPESGGTWLLPRLIGWQKACEVALLGRKLDAAEIHRLGLANAVVPHDELMAEARRWAGEIAERAPLTIAATKRTMRFGLDSTFETNAHQVIAELMEITRTEDFREGMASFVEKREPKYQGR
jgi:enoyl-CoA hydratase/carnithine racemase